MVTSVSGLTSYYRPDKINLWVEDSITKEYLIEVWQDSSVQIHVGGGNQTIRGIVQDASRLGLPNVFGVVDKDYGLSNRLQWENPNSGAKVFILPVHELENYLLDENALASCDLNSLHRSEQEINARLQQEAGLYEWHTSVCCVLAEWHDTILDSFPGHPARNLTTDQVTALAYLTGSLWFQNVVFRASQVTQAGEPGASLTTAHNKVTGWLHNGQWRFEFCGKEIFRGIRGYIYSQPLPADPDIDVAKSVARRQRQVGTVPQDLLVLQSVVHTKAGF